MSSESESFTPEGAENFVAPDESKRVEDPTTAESMARASHGVRSQAAGMRKLGKEFKTEVYFGEEDGKKAEEAMNESAAKVDALADDVESEHELIHKVRNS